MFVFFVFVFVLRSKSSPPPRGDSRVTLTGLCTKNEIFVETRRENPGGSNLEGGLVEVPEGVPEGVEWGIKMFSSLF